MSPFVLVFSLIYVISFLVVVCLDDWFLIWLGLEINMLSFIFLIYGRESMINIESCLKYFFVQSVGSAFFIALFYLNEWGWEMMGSAVLVYSMGGGPFYYWFPSVCEGISWGSCLLLMSMQKFMPMVLVMSLMSEVVWVIVLFSLIAGVVGSFNQVNMKKLMAFSSIHQIGWLLMCMMVDKTIWMLYFLVYLMVVLGVVVKMSSCEVNNCLSVLLVSNKWWVVLMMMNLGGMPPFLGFFLSWVGFYYFIKMDYLIVFFMVMMSVIMFYVYMRVCYGIFLGSGSDVGWIVSMNGGESKKELGVLDLFMIMGVSLGGVMLFIFVF